ncbi:uncharacterized protein YqgC (DUF456 family) [Arcanobacterium pluranimalium]|uniref:DUF456 domain-containing protein n=1 Tax=Arcanobacterium pluranimalium TaxID=108028 RepID=UPI001957F0B3|nr:DUF456 domain-containing protein [Arcanobacterium pluranimalium]MBM7824808.1 uncharacterized protein YqgC (DUF456 family) [Arcanobacterium pluranimalium]
MYIDIITTILAVVAYGVAIAGIIVPVLPGTALIVAATFVWALVVGGSAGWITFGLVALFSAIGITASYVLTGKRLKAAQVPNSSILCGVFGAIIGFFAIPVLGIFIGFAVGLFLAEMRRQGDGVRAASSTWLALKSLGVGILIELGMAFTSAIVFAISCLIYFFGN